jgi:tungstate transport system ATP-binding protein
MMPILEMEKIQYQVATKMILDIPYFELYKGDFLGIMGPNGAGKSTFLKLLAFLDSPTAGAIHYHGEIQSAKSIPLSLRRQLSVALQQSLLLQGTVYENVAMGLTFRKTPKAVIQQRVSDILEMFEISHLAKKSTRELSGGEAQRVSLARALAVEPEILFLDEPFSALDFPTKMKLIEDFQRIIQQTDTTIVFISHDLLEIQALANRLLILIDGNIQQIAETDSIIHSTNPAINKFLAPWKKHLPTLTL